MSTRQARVVKAVGRRVTKSASAPKAPRRCSKCGLSHSAPVGKKCIQTTLFPVTSGNVADVGDRTSTPINTSKGTVHNSINDAPIVADSIIVPDVVSVAVSGVPIQPVLELGVSDKLDHLANAVSALNSRLGVIGNEVQELKVKSNSSRAWDDVLNLSRVSAGPDPAVVQTNNNNNNLVPNITVSQAAAEIVTAQQLRRDPVLVRQANTQQQALQQQTAQDNFQGRGNGDNISFNNNAHIASTRFSNDVRSRAPNSNFSGNVNCIAPSNSIKSGRERVGNPENANVYVCWPQQAVFVGADRQRVRYEDLTQSQWTAGLATMAAQEPNLIIQRNMFVFISSLLQDVCDVGFIIGRGALSLILIMMEESRLSWLELAAVQEVREKYCYRSVVAPTSVQSAHNNSFVTQHSKSKAVRGAQRRVCKNFNSGNCSHASSHVTGGFQYEHFCSHCSIKGSSFPHPENRCRVKGAIASRTENPI